MVRDDARTIVCFGDSNTYGANPTDGGRFPRSVRWTGVLRAALGDGYEVIEQGLNARTTVYPSPLNEGRVGRDMLQPVLWTHAPVDLVTIMLGTNDLKVWYQLTAPEIAYGAATLVDLALRSLAGPGGTPPKVLLIAPPPLAPTTAKSAYWGFERAQATSMELADHYRMAASLKGVDFLDARDHAEASPLDGVHLDEGSHARLGAAVAAQVRRILG
ncbi:MAG: SGNH/GDSL hydrolase family protein [Chloroflexota bacterium]